MVTLGRDDVRAIERITWTICISDVASLMGPLCTKNLDAWTLFFSSSNLTYWPKSMALLGLITRLTQNHFLAYEKWPKKYEKSAQRT